MSGTGRAAAAAHGRVGVRCGVALLLMLLIAAAPEAARAQIGSARYSSIVMEAATGNVLSTVNPDAPRAPASLTKLMTLYMTFEALRDRRIGLNELVPVSAHAASMEPSKLGLVPGTRITVEQAIDALVTKSANDAASALGEFLAGGDEARFGEMMTLRARALGMTHTVFRNASGLPDPEQLTTARDLATLARHLVEDFPNEYHYFSIPSFVFQGRVIPNHDHMLQTYPGADGMKTGYTVASGFNLITSAVRGNVRLIGVVLGAARPGERDQHMAVLLNSAYAQLGVPVEDNVRVAARHFGLVATAQAATLPVARGASVHRVGLRRAAETRHAAAAHTTRHVVKTTAHHVVSKKKPVHDASVAHRQTRAAATAKAASRSSYIRQASRDVGGG